MRCLVLLALCLLTPRLAAAQPVDPRRSEFWESMSDPSRQRARTLLRHGLERLAESEEAYGMHRRAALVEGGITRLRLATTAAPNDPTFLFELGLAVAHHDEQMRDGTLRPRTEEALRVFTDLRGLDASFEAATVAFELGILRTKERDFAGAAREYEHALALALSENETITVHANLAEVLMLAGELDSAIDHFERGVALARDAGPMGERSLVLGLFGLAVALDRAGEQSEALVRAREAMSLAGTTNVLRMDGVFFEPAYEIHHYDGLGQLALVETEPNPAERRTLLVGARASFERYLREGGASGIFADAARRRIADIDATLTPTPTTRARTRR